MDKCENSYHNQNRVRNCRRVSELRISAERKIVDVLGNRERRSSGTSVRQVFHFVKKLESSVRGHNSSQDDYRTQKRKRQSEKHFGGTRAVNQCGFINFAVDVLQSCQKENRIVTSPSPSYGEYDYHARPKHIGEPVFRRR